MPSRAHDRVQPTSALSGVERAPFNDKFSVANNATMTLFDAVAHQRHVVIHGIAFNSSESPTFLRWANALRWRVVAKDGLGDAVCSQNPFCSQSNKPSTWAACGVSGPDGNVAGRTMAIDLSEADLGTRAFVLECELPSGAVATAASAFVEHPAASATTRFSTRITRQRFSTRITRPTAAPPGESSSNGCRVRVCTKVYGTGGVFAKPAYVEAWVAHLRRLGVSEVVVYVLGSAGVPEPIVRHLSQFSPFVRLRWWGWELPLSASMVETVGLNGNGFIENLNQLTISHCMHESIAFDWVIGQLDVDEVLRARPGASLCSALRLRTVPHDAIELPSVWHPRPCLRHDRSSGLPFAPCAHMRELARLSSVNHQVRSFLAGGTSPRGRDESMPSQLVGMDLPSQDVAGWITIFRPPREPSDGRYECLNFEAHRPGGGGPLAPVDTLYLAHLKRAWSGPACAEDPHYGLHRHPPSSDDIRAAYLAENTTWQDCPAELPDGAQWEDDSFAALDPPFPPIE